MPTDAVIRVVIRVQRLVPAKHLQPAIVRVRNHLMIGLIWVRS
jgi:hypothetical protein